MNKKDRKRLIELGKQIGRLPTVGGSQSATVIGLSKLNALVSEAKRQVSSCVWSMVDPESVFDPDDELFELKEIIDRHLSNWR